jgi:large subunit ribosomal protein L1
MAKKDLEEPKVEETELEVTETTTDTPETLEVVEVEEIETAESDTPTAKAGKRSAKSIREKEELVAKEERKADAAEDEDKPKKPVTPTRSRLERRSKGYRSKQELIEADKIYPLGEGLELAKKTSSVKFNATVELHINLGVDPRMADQNIRDTLILPAGTGKKIRVAVLTDDAAEATKSGADVAGTEDLLGQLEKGVMDFDILIATPALMPRLGKYARLLGPRGLMPSPKSGTVTNEVNRAVSEAKAGRIEYRVDSTGIIHLGFGKVSFTVEQLSQNAQAILASIKSNKPNSIKSNYLKTAHLTTTMGPSIPLDIDSF